MSSDRTFLIQGRGVGPAALRLALLLSLACAALALLLAPGRSAAQVSGPVYHVDVDGVVTSFTVDYLRRALQQAEASNATALVIQLRGEGAVLRAVRPFANELAQASVPVVVYVGPSGVQAGAAGALLLSAAHVSAMAPNTSFGSPLPLADVDNVLTEQTRDLLLEEVSQQLRAWNGERGRSTAWVEQGVREGVLLTNEQAMATNPPAINLVARDQAELLTLLEGRTVQLENGQELRLSTLGQRSQPLEPTLWEQLLLLLANPTIAFMLLVMAAVAIYAELITPSIGLFAGIGVVLLLAALVGLLALPVRWVSLIVLLLAFGIIGADFFVPSHGGLTIVGLALLVVSALTLIDTNQAPGVGVSGWAVTGVSGLVVAVTAFGFWLIVRTRNRPVVTGQEGLIGRVAEVRQRIDPEGMVFVEGALWRALSDDGPIETGEYVRITAAYNLRLAVQRIETDEE
ncbi:MAG: nodulation protein NfeD [Chloroflexaceae bacterium]|jgi:membrane-bound serine protease (ClpP class)|nr:nodulation protein NfeD [Chloroflexaceae bacterium]